jgi:cellulose biosynthesis protein BcsQ
VFACCWSSKGGSGTTVVAAALAVVHSKSCPAGALAVDLAGDVAAVLGLADEPGGAGVAEWLAGGELVPADGLARVELTVHPALALVPRGRVALQSSRGAALAALLRADPRSVVVDGGWVGADAPAARTDLVGAVAANADHSLLVLRPCFLALRRALHAPIRPTGVVLLVEEGRALTPPDVEDVLGVPVQAAVSVTAQVARAVDAGLLASRLPRTLERELRHAA